MLKQLLGTQSFKQLQLLEDLGIDTVVTSEWAKFETLVSLFEPFTIYAESLQNDSQPVSQVVLSVQP